MMGPRLPVVRVLKLAFCGAKSALVAASGNVSFLALIKTGTLTNDSKISPTVIRCYARRRIYLRAS